MRRVRISAPDLYEGRLAVLDGDRFQYPGQGFWVQPVILEDGRRVLVTRWSELPEEPERSYRGRFASSD